MLSRMGTGQFRFSLSISLFCVFSRQQIPQFRYTSIDPFTAWWICVITDHHISTKLQQAIGSHRCAFTRRAGSGDIPGWYSGLQSEDPPVYATLPYVIGLLFVFSEKI